MIQFNSIPEYPGQLHFEINTKCNLACGFCPVHKAPRGTPLTPDEWLGVIKSVQPWAGHVGYVDLVNYDEPLLDKNCWLYASAINHLWGFGKLGWVSNGTVMTDDIAARLIGLQLKQMVFSVDAFTAETYARVRPLADGRQDLSLRDRVYANVEAYIAFLTRIGSHALPVIQMTVCDINAHEVDAFRRHWESRPVACVEVLNCTGRGGERSWSAPNDTPCRVILDGLWVLSDGRVVACCEDWAGESVIGDVREESLSRIWRGRRIEEFRKAHFETRKRSIAVCAHCKTSQDVPDHNRFPANTNKAVLAEWLTARMAEKPAPVTMPSSVIGPEPYPQDLPPCDA